MSSRISILNSESIFSKISTVIGVIVVLLLCLSLFSLLYEMLQNRGPYRTTIEGKILSKQTRFGDSQMGSSIRWLIVIEEKNGHQEMVKVDEQTYQRAQIGQWLKKDGWKYQLEDKEFTKEIMTPK